MAFSRQRSYFDIGGIDILNYFNELQDNSLIGVVDDDHDTRSKIEQIVSSLAFSAEHYAEGVPLGALIAPRLCRCYFINICDNDSEALNHIAQLSITPYQRPIIAMMASNDVTLAIKVMAAGAHEILLKPFSKTQFLNLFRELPVQQ